MRKSDNQQVIEIKGNTALIGGRALQIDTDINDWLSKFRISNYSIDESNNYFKVYSMKDYQGIYVYTKGDSVFQVSVALFPNTVRFEGRFIIEGRSVPIPFLSADHEKVFPGLLLKTVNSIYKNTFDPNWPNYFPNSDNSGLKVYVDRNIKYISLICLEGALNR